MVIGPMLVCLFCATSNTYAIQSENHEVRENQMSDQQAIEAAISEFVKAYNAGDLDKVQGYYGDDLIKIRNGAPAETKSDTAQRIAAVFAKFHSRVDVVTDEIRTSGDMAYTRGSFRVTLTPKTGDEAQVIERRYLEIWRKEHGRWLVVRTMDNID